MSRRRRPIPQAPRPRPDGYPGAPGRSRSRAVRVIGREIAIGAVLWGTQTGHPIRDAALYVLCFAATLLAAPRGSVLAPGPGRAVAAWGPTWREALFLFAGGLCLAHLMRAAVGPASWLGSVPS